MDQKLYQDAINGVPGAYASLKDAATQVIVNMGNKTILHVESMHGCQENVQYILKNFGDRDLLIAVDSNQETALHLAAYFGHTEVVKVLIDEARRLFRSSDKSNGNFFEAFLRKINGKKNTALHLAVSNNNVDIVGLIVKADPDHIHDRNREGHSPIYLAADRGYSDIVKLICTVCTTPTLDGPRGKTALHAAITRFHQGMHY